MLLSLNEILCSVWGRDRETVCMYMCAYARVHRACQQRILSGTQLCKLVFLHLSSYEYTTRRGHLSYFHTVKKLKATLACFKKKKKKRAVYRVGEGGEGGEEGESAPTSVT